MISPCIQFMEGGTGGDPRMDPTMEDWIDAKWYKARPMILLRSLSSISLIGFFHVRSIRARSPAATEEAAAAATAAEARDPPTAAIGRRPCSGARTAARGTGRAGAAPRKRRICEKCSSSMRRQPFPRCNKHRNVRTGKCTRSFFIMPNRAEIIIVIRAVRQAVFVWWSTSLVCVLREQSSSAAVQFEVGDLTAVRARFEMQTN